MAVLERLAYVLRAETEGLAGDLKGAENQMGKFTRFVERNPLAAAGALGAAMISVGVKATTMAAEVERGLLRIERVVPGAVGQMARLKEEVEGLSRISPRTQADLARAADAIARGGVESVEGLALRLQATTRAADASGEELTGIIGGLDQALDLFGMSSADSEGMLAKLFATAKGRFPLEDLFAALQSGAKIINEFGIDFETATRALGALLERGLTAKQAASTLKEYGELGREGADAIRALAESHVIATDAVQDYDAAILRSRDSMDSAWAIAKNNFAAVMIDLGERILPTVTQAAKAAAGAMALVTGDVEDVYVAAAASSVRTRGADVTSSRFRADVSRLNRNVVGGNTAKELAGMSLAELGQMQLNLARFTTETGAATSEVRLLEAALATAQVNAAKLALTQAQAAVATADAARAGAAGATGGTAVLTPEQIKARQKAQEELLETLRKNAIEAGKVVDKLMAEWDAKQRAVSEDFKRWSVEMTRTLVDDIQAEFAPRIAAALEVGNTAFAEGLQAEMAKAVAAQKEIERIAARKDIGVVVTRETLERLQTQKELVIDIRDAMREVKGTGAEPETNDGIEGAVRSIANAAAGALALAEAFGAVDESAARVAQSATIIAANIGAALKGDIGAIFQVAGSVAQLISGFGKPSALTEQRNRENDASARAVARLADSLGDLITAGISGTQFGKIQSATGQFLGGVNRRAAGSGFSNALAGSRELANADAFFESLGIPFEDVERLAKSLGVTLNGTAESFRELQRAMDAADFAAYISTFAGQIDLLNDRFEVYGITDPTEKFRKYLAALMDPDTGAPAIFSALAGIDISTAEGREAAKKVLQGLFERGAAGTLTADELGGLSPKEFIAAVMTALGYLGAAPPGGAAAGSGANAGVISGFRGLTEAAGNRLADYARMQVDLQSRILAHLDRWAAPVLLPPALNAGGATSGAGVQVTVTITQHNYGVGDTAGVGRSAAAGARLGTEQAITAAGFKRAMLAVGDLRAM